MDTTVFDVTRSSHETPPRFKHLSPRLTLTLGFVAADVLVVVCAYFAAVSLRFGGQIPANYFDSLRIALLVLIPLHVAANGLFGLYWRGWRYASFIDAIELCRASALATIIAFVGFIVLASGDSLLPMSCIPIGGMLALFGFTGVRFWQRAVNEFAFVLSRKEPGRLLIIGAGTAGQLLARELLVTRNLGYEPIGFVDDDPNKLGQRIHGLSVLGNRRDIARLVTQYKIETITFAIADDSISYEDKRQILAICGDTSARVQIFPPLKDLITGTSPIVHMRELQIEDLLGRPPVVFSKESVSDEFSQSVLITGAAGSIGSELARQVVLQGTSRLILVDTNESGLFDIAAELTALAGTARSFPIEVVISDVTRAQRITKVLNEHRPTLVFHAAAYKHVPLLEDHIEEGVLTNVVGTYNMCVAARDAGVKRFVFISTDKAVDPANVLGATKRVGERIVESFSRLDGTIFCAVRFGNVLGSRGSVVPTFERQIRQGGPVTITHHSVTRYFMTIPEAARLIIEASSQATGGEIFVLDMGAPVPILDLANRLIRLHGLRPGIDIEIREIGLRPGEKMHESLVTRSERVMETEHPRVWKILPREGDLLSPSSVAAVTASLRSLTEADQPGLLRTSLFEIANGTEVIDTAASLFAKAGDSEAPQPDPNGRMPVQQAGIPIAPRRSRAMILERRARREQQAGPVVPNASGVAG